MGGTALFVALTTSGIDLAEGENARKSVFGDIVIATSLLLPPVGLIAGATCGHRYEYIVVSDSTRVKYDEQINTP